jgi:hypothetical protein
MKRFLRRRMNFAFAVSVVALVAAGVGTSSASTDPTLAGTTVVRATTTSAGAVTRTFSFIGPRGSKTTTVVNIDGLTINARCNTAGAPIIFAFSGVAKADILGRVFDGQGRLHSVHNTSLGTGASVQLSTSSSDFDGSGNVLFETSAGKVVTVSYAFDNATTLGKQNVCTVYGSFVAS